MNDAPASRLVGSDRFDPGGPGGFDFRDPKTADAFDAHVREQLPWYDLATGIVAHIARSIVPANGKIIDVGCSTGNIGRALNEIVHRRPAILIGIDSSKAMLDRYTASGKKICAAAEEFNFGPEEPDLIVCFLVLQFITPWLRARMIDRMKQSLRPGGALVVFDRVDAVGGEAGQISSRLVLAAKYEAGARPKEVIRKELSLAGIQRPLDPRELEDFVPIFRFADFVGAFYLRPKVA